MEEKYSWPGWETVRLIGRGSFGGVYEIRRDVFGHEEKAAMKVITIPQNDSDAEELFDSGYDEQSVTETFRSHLESIVNEYTLMRQMNGAANVVNCDDFRIVEHVGKIGWDIFIKMELLTPLTRAVGREPSEEQVRRIAHDLCSALVLCKKYGIIHRDIKPQNIFVSQNGDYKLGDFGIAKTVEKTSGGTKIGTYKYMAPEVYNNQPYNLTADIYSLGLVLHWLLNERRSPFMPLPPTPATAALEDEARARRFAGEPIPAPAHGSEGLKRIVLKACAFDPKARYQSAEEMLRDVEALSAPAPVSVDPGQEDAPTELPTAEPAEEATVSSPAPKHETIFHAQPAVQPDAPEAEPSRNYPARGDETVTLQTPRPAPAQGPAAAPAHAPAPAPVVNPAPAPQKKKARWPLFAVLAAVLALVVGAVFLLRGSALPWGGAAKTDKGEWRVIAENCSGTNSGEYSLKYTYDADGHRLFGYRNEYYAEPFYSYECDADGNILRRSQKNSNRYTVYQYDANGLCVKEELYAEGEDGEQYLMESTERGYDSEGRQNKYIYYRYEYNEAEGGGYEQELLVRAEMQYDGFHAVGLESTTMDHVTVVQTFDDRDRLIRQENTRSNESDPYFIREITYDENGNMLTDIQHTCNTEGTWAYSETEYEYLSLEEIRANGGYHPEEEDLAGTSEPTPEPASPAGEWAPAGPVTLIVAYKAGSGTDNSTRLLAKYAEKYVGQTIIVENAEGGSGSIGWSRLAEADPDGLTIGVINLPNFSNSIVNGFGTYTAADFRAICNHVTETSVVIVRAADDRFPDLNALVEFGRANPDTLKASTNGIKATNHIAVQAFAKSAGFKYIDIPQAGTGDQLLSLSNTESDFTVVKLGDIVGQESEYRILGVFAEERLPELADVPTLGELGFYEGWLGSSRCLVAPAGVSDDVIAFYEAAFKAAMEDPEYLAAAEQAGMLTDYKDAAETDALIARQQSFAESHTDEFWSQ